MRILIRGALALLLIATLTPQVVAQGPASSQPISFSYRDDDGTGRLLLAELGADPATGGRQIKVTIVQNGVTFQGSGISLQLSDQMPFPTLLTFGIVSPRGVSYFFQGRTTSGITLSGQGTFHRTGAPEQKGNWSIVLAGGGGTGGGGGTTAKSGIRGLAEAGPIKPVQRPGEKNTAPLPGAIITIQPSGGGAEITRQKADQNGRFEIPLSPGTYRLVPLPPQPGAVYPRGTPQTVTVKTGKFTEVTVEYDTGIR
jgi:hypothetical protein